MYFRVKYHLCMESFMFQSHEKNSSDLPRHLHFTGRDVVVQLSQPAAHTVTEIDDLVKGRPILLILRHLRVRLERCVISEISHDDTRKTVLTWH